MSSLHCTAGPYARPGDDSEPWRLASEQEQSQPSPPPYLLMVWLGRLQGHHLANLGHDEGHHHGPRQVSGSVGVVIKINAGLVMMKATIISWPSTVWSVGVISKN